MGDGDRLVPVSAIMRFVDRIQREAVCLHGFELRQHGAVRTEGYYAPFRPGEPHRMYSVSKSMVALAVGLLEAEVKLRLEDSIAGYFEDLLPSEPEERLLRLTVEQMLRMATCHCATTYIKDVDANWALTFFRKATSHEPGIRFCGLDRRSTTSSRLETCSAPGKAVRSFSCPGGTTRYSEGMPAARPASRSLILSPTSSERARSMPCSCAARRIMPGSGLRQAQARV